MTKNPFTQIKQLAAFAADTRSRSTSIRDREWRDPEAQALGDEAATWVTFPREATLPRPTCSR